MRRVIITGAGAGLGRALALEFSRQGFRVAVTDRDERLARKTCDEIVQQGGIGLACALDVTSEKDFEDTARLLERDWGGVDVVINNAGVAASGKILDAPLADWQWIYEINVLGVVRGCKAFLPMLQKQSSGHIVNIASIAGIASPPGMGSYNVTKAGVISLSETLRAEVSRYGIGVTVVCPYFFQSQLMDEARTPDPKANETARRLMAESKLTAEAVAAETFRAVQDGRFQLVLPKEARKMVLLKRMSPELFFRAMGKWAKRARRAEAEPTLSTN